MQTGRWLKASMAWGLARREGAGGSSLLGILSGAAQAASEEGSFLEGVSFLDLFDGGGEDRRRSGVLERQRRCRTPHRAGAIAVLAALGSSRSAAWPKQNWTPCFPDVEETSKQVGTAHLKINLVERYMSRWKAQSQAVVT